MLKPDEQLKQIIKSNKPGDIEKRKQLDPYIIDAVKRGGNIPLNNFNTSFLSRKIAPYESRGTGLPVSVFKQLMLFDMLRECHDDQTEVLTDSGFKFISELMEENKSLNIKPQDVNGVYLENDKVSGIYTMKKNFKVLQYNEGNFEYVKPEGAALSHYNGEMYRFNSRNYDVLVTPNHKMYTKGKDWELVNAKDLYGSNKYFRFNRYW